MSSIGGHGSISMHEWETMPLDAKRFLARSRNMLLSDLEAQVQLANALVSSSNMQNQEDQAARKATEASGDATENFAAQQREDDQARSTRSTDEDVATTFPTSAVSPSSQISASTSSTQSSLTEPSQPTTNNPLPVPVVDKSSSRHSKDDETQGVVKYAVTDFFGLRGLRSTARRKAGEGAEADANSEYALIEDEQSSLPQLPIRVSAVSAKSALRSNEDSPDRDLAPVLLLLPELLLTIFGLLDGDALGYALMTQLGKAALRIDASDGSAGGNSCSTTSPTAHGGNATTAAREKTSSHVADGLFAGLCQRTYLVQSRRKAVDPRLWGGWRSMWLKRPRVRTNGFYCMASEWAKPRTLDLWGDHSSSLTAPVLKLQSFRYFRFFPDGTMTYALTPAPPEHMTRALALKSTQAAAAAALKPRHHRNVDGHLKPEVYPGRYSMHKNSVLIGVRTHFNTVHFTLELTHGVEGHFCRLEVKKHHSKGLASGSLTSGHPESIGHAFWFLRAYPTAV